MPELSLDKHKLKIKSKRNIYVFHREQGVNIDTAELNIKNRSMHDLETENLDLHYEMT